MSILEYLGALIHKNFGVSGVYRCNDNQMEPACLWGRCTYATGFIAINPQGKVVEGTVCSGVFKGATIRF